MCIYKYIHICFSYVNVSVSCNIGEKVRWDPKPIEKRTLYVPSNNSSQGVVQCWVDIMEPAVAQSFPPEDVALPPIQVYIYSYMYTISYYEDIYHKNMYTCTHV